MKKPTIQQLAEARKLLDHLRASVINRRDDNKALLHVSEYLYMLEGQWAMPKTTKKSNNLLN